MLVAGPVVTQWSNMSIRLMRIHPCQMYLGLFKEPVPRQLILLLLRNLILSAQEIILEVEISNKNQRVTNQSIKPYSDKLPHKINRPVIS